MDQNVCTIAKIEKFCIGCLQKCEDMCNISENSEIKKMFFTLFQELMLDNKEYDKYICKACNEKLYSSYEFYNQVKKSYEFFQKYVENKKVSENINESVKEEGTNSDNEIECFDEPLEEDDEFSESDNEPLIKKQLQSPKQKLKKVAPDEVEKAIENFRQECNENINCIFCNFIGVNIRTLSIHMKYKHRNEKENWCYRCNSLFDNIKKHKNICSKTVLCQFCKRTVCREYYMEHLKNHAGYDFECKICEKKLISQSSLEIHFAKHENQRPFQCPSCAKTFRLSVTLNDHVKTHSRYNCRKCDKHFEIPELLTSHICTEKKENSGGYTKHENVESSDFFEDTEELGKDALFVKVEENVAEQKKIEVQKSEDLVCSFCQKPYKTAYRLQLHIKGHMGDLPFKCQYCQKSFSSKGNWKDHERTHTKEKDYICSFCGKGFGQPSTLRTHMRQHTGRPEECDICKKRFCRKSELRLHLQKHRGEKPFLCTDCGRSFSQKSHLTSHLIIHTDQRPFHCNFCDKRFKSSNMLKAHSQLHTGLKPFSCTHCSYSCYKRYRLSQHMKMHVIDEDRKEKKENICPICGKGYATLNFLNTHMSNMHNALV